MAKNTSVASRPCKATVKAKFAELAKELGLRPTEDHTDVGGCIISNRDGGVFAAVKVTDKSGSTALVFPSLGYQKGGDVIMAYDAILGVLPVLRAATQPITPSE